MKIVLALLFLVSCFIHSPVRSFGSDLSALFNANESSVVTIKTDKCIGTGFYIADKFIVTNLHVIKGSKNIKFFNNYKDGSTPVNSIVLTDETNDLAIIFTEKLGKPVQLAPYDSVSTGEELCTIGSPKGFEKTIAPGILSQKRKDGKMQISVPSSPGSSGSPVFTMGGKVVGVVVSVVEDAQNLNFAIPSDKVIKLASRVNGVPKLQYIDVSKNCIQDSGEISDSHVGLVEIDYALIDTSLPGCKRFSSTVIGKTNNGVVKQCVCNERVTLTNLFCKCQECTP